MHYDSENHPSLSPALWLTIGLGICLGLGLSPNAWAQAPHPPIGAAAPGQLVLPPPEEIPEEILRTEVIFEARSPLDGSPLSPSEYAQLKTELAEAQTTLTLNADIRQLVLLLQARRVFKPIIPFLP